MGFHLPFDYFLFSHVGKVSLYEVWTILQSPFMNSQVEMLYIKDQC